MATKTTFPVVALALALGAVTGALVIPGAFRSNDNSYTVAGSTPSGWSEVPWPFPADQFGRGKAFRCDAADCGKPATLYVRAKICLLYTSPSPRDRTRSRMPSSA